MDEPGSYLLSSEQEELLKELRRISDTNTILYCSHSQHLLDPEIINIGQTRIVQKDAGKIRVVPFGSAGSSNYQGALTPLYEALQMRTGVFNRDIKNAVIAEGITDFYWFSMLKEHASDWDLTGIDLIPGAGAGHLKELISWAIAWTDRYLVLLDSDEAGLAAFKTYERFFGVGEISNFLMYSTPSAPNDVQLEDLMSEPDKARLMSIVDAKNVKAAIMKLYFEDNDKQTEFFDGLDKTTTENLSVIRAAVADFAK